MLSTKYNVHTQGGGEPVSLAALDLERAFVS